MKTVALNINDNENGRFFKCSLIEGEHNWRCVLYQENFRFQFIIEPTLIACLEHLAHYLEPMHDTVIFGEKNSDEMYIAILKGYIRILRSQRLLNRRMQG